MGTTPKNKTCTLSMPANIPMSGQSLDLMIMEVVKHRATWVKSLSVDDFNDFRVWRLQNIEWKQCTVNIPASQARYLNALHGAVVKAGAENIVTTDELCALLFWIGIGKPKFIVARLAPASEAWQWRSKAGEVFFKFIRLVPRMVLWSLAAFGAFSLLAIMAAPKPAINVGQATESVAPQSAYPAPANTPQPAAAISPGLPDFPHETEVKWGPVKTDLAHTIYVFSDPRCSKCQEFEVELEKLPPNYSVNIYPSPILGIDSEMLVAGIACSKNKVAAWKDAIHGSMAETTDCSTAGQAVQRAQQFFRAFGFSGTPTLIAGDGRVHEGRVPDLQAWLAGK